MTWTLGTYTTLVNPLRADVRRTDEGARESWRMADGSVRVHVVGNPRYVWEYRFDVLEGTEYDELKAAYDACWSTTKTFDPPVTDDANTYTVTVYDWNEEAYTAAAGTRYKVSFTIEETTS